MPRGFLVKRSKRTSPASYRMREADSGAHGAELPLHVAQGGVPVTCSGVRSPERGNERRTGVQAATEQVQLTENLEKGPDYPRDYTTDGISRHQLGSPGRADASYSPIKPVGSDQGKSFFERCLSSPATAESFPTCAPVPSMERLLTSPADLQLNAPVHMCAPLEQNSKRSCFESDRKVKPAAKRPKVTRKLSFEDEVTTSPVLGLKIKKEGPDPKTPSSVRRKPLGEFICQLCKEEYPDPFSLAQHKCSRIVRVEYRCPDCDKVFSCPANLASHRRWHKPRPMNHAELGGKKELEKPVTVDGKENDQHHSPPDSSQPPTPQHRPAHGFSIQDKHRRNPQENEALERLYKAPEKRMDTHHIPGGDQLFPGCSRAADAIAGSYLLSACPPEEVYECQYCEKKFRRQAYLKKHQAAHETLRSASYNQIESGQITFPCQLCGAHFPSVEIRDKHRLWHAVRDELLACPTKAAGTSAFAAPDVLQSDQQIFSCKHCPSTFFSSPGLTRHINKAHPTESRQVMLLQMAVRPGC
ncbi:insulinoma-associated protein 2 [Brienomyrus brachyistius]|uniref:insulinoma-associated protein 2 n=1 Tax=Brienomyrus brachyistius TaxID=42636 RepID=UPI0020B3747D|nr:insulinoma-associated protein 2 [Brienomyrus brachyistius]